MSFSFPSQTPIKNVHLSSRHGRLLWNVSDCFMFSECHGVSRHETVFQQPLLVDHTQIYFASSLQRVLRGACRRRRRKKFISPTHEHFAVVLVKKNIVACNVGEEPFVPWRHCFLCEGREGGNGHAMLNSFELANLTSPLTPPRDSN